MRILIVDDSAELRALINRVLRRGGFAEIDEAASAEELYELIGLGASNVRLLHPVDAILLDIDLPGTNGIDACRRIKSDVRFRDVPIVMVTGSSDMGLLHQSFEAGACDFITKPLHPVELLARLRSVGRLKAEMERRVERERELLAVKKALEEANSELKRLSLADGLTGIFNRRYFDRVLRWEWNRAQRGNRPLSLVLLDIDYFKKFNDTYGHQLGDECLIAVARALQASAKRSTDLVARFGGEEFAAILPDFDYERALVMGQRLNQAAAELSMKHSTSNVSPFVTVSVGIGTIVPFPDQEPSLLIGQADKALYESKATGRNRVTHARDILLASRNFSS